MCYMIYCKGKLCFHVFRHSCWLRMMSCNGGVWFSCFSSTRRQTSFSKMTEKLQLVWTLHSRTPQSWNVLKRCSNKHFDTQWTRFLLKNSHTNASKLLLCTSTYNFCNVSISFLLHCVHLVNLAKRHRYREKEPSVFSLVPCEAHRPGPV